MRTEHEIPVEVDDNIFNDKLERSMEDQENQHNERQETSKYDCLENVNGKFYWPRSFADTQDLIESEFCLSMFQQAQAQCC